MKLEKFRKSNKFILICVLLLCVQCILLIFCNLTLANRNIDRDSSEVFVHAIEMWRNKQILIPDWVYTTTLELDCALLLAAPLFGVTGDIYLSFALSNICFAALWLWVLYRLLQGRGKLCFLLAANLILIPYTIGQLDYYNMLFFNGGQYVVKTLLPLMLIVLLTNAKQNCTQERNAYASKQQLLLLTLYGILLLINTFSSGIYVVVCGLMPVLAGYFVYRWYHREKFNPYFYVYAIGTLLISFVGYGLNVLLRINAKGNQMTLCPVTEIAENISANFWGLFELFGGAAYESVRVMSFRGISILVRMGFVDLLLGFGIIAFGKFIKRKTDIGESMLLTVFIWNTFVISICETRYGATSEYRYHLMGMIPLVCVAVIEFSRWYESSQERREKAVMECCCTILILVMGVTAYRKVLMNDTQTGKYREICDYAARQEVDTVYFLRDTGAANICRLLDYKNGDIVYVVADHTGESEYTVYVHDYYAKYNSQQVKLENAMLVMDHDRFGDTEDLELFDHTYHRIQTIDNYSIYR